MTSVPAPHAPAARPLIPIGELFRLTFATARKHWRLLARVYAIPLGLILASTLISGWFTLDGNTAVRTPDSVTVNMMPSSVLLILLAFMVAIVVMTIPAQAQNVLIVEDDVNGRPVDQLAERSQGIIGRVLPATLALGAAAAVVFGAMALILLLPLLGFGGMALILLLPLPGTLQDATSPGDVGASILSVLGIGFIFLVLLIAVSFYFSVRFLYLTPVATLDRIGNFAALRQSWNITKASFWGLLGRFLLFAVAIGAASFVVSLPVGVMSAIATRSAADAGMGPIPIIFLIVTSLLDSLVRGVSLVVSATYIGYLFLDQTGRIPPGVVRTPQYPGPYAPTYPPGQGHYPYGPVPGPGPEPEWDQPDQAPVPPPAWGQPGQDQPPAPQQPTWDGPQPWVPPGEQQQGYWPGGRPPAGYQPPPPPPGQHPDSFWRRPQS